MSALATPRPANPAPQVISELYDLSGLTLREIEERTKAHAKADASVTAARLCLYQSGKITLRDEQLHAVEKVLREEVLARSRRIARVLGRELGG
jgi:hypothetical protein